MRLASSSVVAVSAAIVEEGDDGGGEKTGTNAKGALDEVRWSAFSSSKAGKSLTKLNFLQVPWVRN